MTEGTLADAQSIRVICGQLGLDAGRHAVFGLQIYGWGIWDHSNTALAQSHTVSGISQDAPDLQSRALPFNTNGSDRTFSIFLSRVWCPDHAMPSILHHFISHLYIYEQSLSRDFTSLSAVQHWQRPSHNLCSTTRPYSQGCTLCIKCDVLPRVLHVRRAAVG